MQVDDEITYIMCVWDYVDVQGHTCRQANEEGQQQSSDGPHAMDVPMQRESKRKRSPQKS